jgi:hypothetical protein
VPEYIYGPEKDLKINADGSTKKDIWTTPDKFKTKSNKNWSFYQLCIILIE